MCFVILAAGLLHTNSIQNENKKNKARIRETRARAFEMGSGFGRWFFFYCIWMDGIAWDGMSSDDGGGGAGGGSDRAQQPCTNEHDAHDAI